MNTISRLGIIILLVILSMSANSQNTDQWFNVTEVGPKVWLLDDHGAANIYVVEGNKKALIIDTGLGAADLLGAVRKITDKPLIVVNTHGHPDHAGANYQFEKVYVHQADMEAARMFSSKEQRERAGAAMLGGQKPAEEDQFRGEEFATELIAVSEGFKFDLGGRVLEVMETPGHTPGGICLLDVQNKLLFSGDNNNSLVWLFLEGCLPLSGYLKTLEMQVSRLDEFTTLFPGHGPAMGSDFIHDQVECVKSILDGSCQAEPYETFAGDAMLCKKGRAMVAFNPENL